MDKQSKHESKRSMTKRDNYSDERIIGEYRPSDLGNIDDLKAAMDTLMRDKAIEATVSVLSRIREYPIENITELLAAAQLLSTKPVYNELAMVLKSFSKAIIAANKKEADALKVNMKPVSLVMKTNVGSRNSSGTTTAYPTKYPIINTYHATNIRPSGAGEASDSSSSSVTSRQTKSGSKILRSPLVSPVKDMKPAQVKPSEIKFDTDDKPHVPDYDTDDEYGN